MRKAGSAVSAPIAGLRNQLRHVKACAFTKAVSLQRLWLSTCGEPGRTTGKAVGGGTAECLLHLAATLPVVISDTEAVYLYGLDIIAQQQSERMYYMHDGPGSLRPVVAIP